MPRRRKVLSFDSKLVAYSAMAGAVIAGGEARAADCGGGILIDSACYTDIPDQVLTDDGAIPIDFDGDGTPEFDLRFKDVFTSTSPCFKRSACTTEYRTAWLDPTATAGAAMLEGFGSTLRGEHAQLPGALVPGDTVGAPGFGAWESLTNWGILGTFFRYWGSGYFLWNTGNFIGKGERFAGVRFDLDEGATTHYGWARVSVAPNTNSVTIYDFAFEMTPDTPCPTDLGIVFIDGFENGGTDGWTNLVP